MESISESRCRLKSFVTLTLRLPKHVVQDIVLCCYGKKFMFCKTRMIYGTEFGRDCFFSELLFCMSRI